MVSGLAVALATVAGFGGVEPLVSPVEHSIYAVSSIRWEDPASAVELLEAGDEDLSAGDPAFRDVGHGDTGQGDGSVRPEVAEDEGGREDAHTEGGSGGSDDGEEMFNLLGDGVLLCLQSVLLRELWSPRLDLHHVSTG